MTRPSNELTAVPTRWRRIARVAGECWGAVGITLLLFALAESAARLILELRGTPLSPRMAADSYPPEPWVAELFRETAISSRMRWESYTYWRRLPFSGQVVNVDARGFRRTWQPPPLPGLRLPRVFVVGDSAVWGTGVRDEHTIPSELARYLAAAGRSAEVTNLGESGYVSTQSLIALLRELQRGAAPDLVVFYGGAPDAESARADGREAGLPMNESHRRREFNLLRHPRRLVRETVWAVAARSALGQLLGLGRAPAPLPLAAPALVDQVLGTFETNRRVFEALAANFGFQVRFFWKPIILNKAHLTPWETNRENEIQDAPWLRALDARVKRDWNAAADPHRMYLGDLFATTSAPRYIDGFHTGELANTEIAAAIGRRLVSEGLPALATERGRD